jgi:hypothetical protein
LFIQKVFAVLVGFGLHTFLPIQIIVPYTIIIPSKISKICSPPKRALFFIFLGAGGFAAQKGVFKKFSTVLVGFVVVFWLFLPIFIVNSVKFNLFLPFSKKVFNNRHFCCSAVCLSGFSLPRPPLFSLFSNPLQNGVSAEWEGLFSGGFGVSGLFFLWGGFWRVLGFFFVGFWGLFRGGFWLFLFVLAVVWVGYLLFLLVFQRFTGYFLHFYYFFLPPFFCSAFSGLFI